MKGRAKGFSLIELTIAMGIMMVITGTMFALLNPSQDTFAAQGEVSDLQQRLRLAHDTLSRDLLMAGAGPYVGPIVSLGALNYYFAPVLPYNQGVLVDDPPGSYFTDRITLFYVPATTAESTLLTEFTSTGSGTGTLTLNAEQDCPGTLQLCGFSATMNQMVLVVDGNSGSYDTFNVTAVNDAAGTIDVALTADSNGTTYPKDSVVMEIFHRTYYLKRDTTTGCTNCNDQLVYYGGSQNAEVPVVDHVVDLKFVYYGEQQPPRFKDPSDPSLGVTYGPKPQLGAANCVLDATAPAVPKLSPLGDGTNDNTLVELTAAQLSDGVPSCPNDTNLNRWDADLLRIRKIGVTLRVESAVSALRGPAGTLFTHGGTSRGGNKWVPDQEIRFQVSPRNLNLGR